MPGGKDIPDWGSAYTDSLVRPLYDDAELAARLESPVTLDRRGAVVWLDYFKHGLEKYTLNEISGGTVELINDVVWHGAFAAKLATTTTTGSQAGVQYSFPLIETNFAGLSLMFRPSGTQFDLKIRMPIEFEGTSYLGQVRFDFNAPNVSIHLNTSTGEVALVSDENLGLTGTEYNFFKMVFNLDDKKYHRMILNSIEYDLSPHAIASSVGGLIASIDVFPQLLETNSLAADCHIDNIIFTVAEPFA